MLDRLRRLVFGHPRDLTDPGVFHHVSLIAFLAWVGLGADGLSSSAYGPDEAFRALGPHQHLSILLVAMTAVTIVVISASYANLIEHFPSGGGGYVVATKLLGEKAGVVSGSALLVDYVLTITVSIASGCDQFWNFLPAGALAFKLPAEMLILGFLVTLNLRGIKESVTFLAPIFLVFVVGHAMAIGWAFLSHLPLLPEIFRDARTDFHGSVATVGFWPLAFILLRAYSLGGGTYTGIEAVSNGLTILREPRVKTGRKTMALMAASLTFTAGGILFGYLLVGAVPVAGKTMNFVLFDRLFHGWGPLGTAIIGILLISESALLFVAAQTGFLDGPRVLSNMALDSWVPHRFAQLSDRLVTKNGVFLMGLLAMAALLYTRGNISMLVVMYSINVFLTFSLTLLGMSRHWIAERRSEPRWGRLLLLHGSGFLLCVTILCVTLYEKFRQGGWVTTVVTGIAIAICFAIRTHYKNVQDDLKRLDDILVPVVAKDSGADSCAMLDRSAPTAILTVDRFSGFGLHQLLNIHSLFPGYFKNLVFVSVAVVDSGTFKGAAEMAAMERETREMLDKYVVWASSHGWAAGYRTAVDTEAVDRVVRLCTALKQDFPRAVVFSGKLIFKREKWYHKFLHNETAMAIQRRLQFEGVQSIVLPVRVM